MTGQNQKYLHTAEDGITRCWWGHEHLDYQAYHDDEWGRPTTDDFRLFEKICLEGFQSGLSWLTILRKRENFRNAFADFNFEKVAGYDESSVAALLQNAGIIRHRGKIEATINNARHAIELASEYGSLAAYIWEWEPAGPEPHSGTQPWDWPHPGITRTSQNLSKDLKKRGWKFFGPTTAYAFMQAMGLVNDHIEGCAFREPALKLRKKLAKPASEKKG